jgi:hypothetical protein
MDDPELHGDEQILMRTQGVHVKSISFEAILTNKRIILVDRIKNVLPPKEIPLATIQSVESGENAIRDLVITLGVITKTGGTRQMVLTFSREGGGNRIKERDEWVKQIKNHLTPSFEQVIRKVIPGIETPQPGQNKIPSHPRETTGSQIPARSTGVAPAAKKVAENPPESWQAPPVPSPAPEGILGIYCTKCGTKVPEGSGFCNKCGTRIILPGEHPKAPVVAPAPLTPASTTPKERPIDYEIRSIEPLIEKSTLTTPRDPLRSVPPVPEARPASPAPVYPATPVAPEQPSASAVPPAAPPAKKRFMPRLFSPKDLPPSPLVPLSMPAAVPPRPKKPANKKKILLVAGIIVIILIAVVAVVVILPKMGSFGNLLHGSNASSASSATTAVVTTKSTSSSGSTVVAATLTPVTIPQTGVYVYVNYLGGWKGTYGTSGNQKTVTNSGERDMEVVNATGTVNASFWKRDSSSHEITVSIYKDGTVLTSGTTAAANGKVTLSVDTTTGVAQQPVVGGSSGTTTTVPVTNTTVKITTTSTTNVTATVTTK